MVTQYLNITMKHKVNHLQTFQKIESISRDLQLTEQKAAFLALECLRTTRSRNYSSRMRNTNALSNDATSSKPPENCSRGHS